MQRIYLMLLNNNDTVVAHLRPPRRNKSIVLISPATTKPWLRMHRLSLADWWQGLSCNTLSRQLGAKSCLRVPKWVPHFSARLHEQVPREHGMIGTEGFEEYTACCHIYHDCPVSLYLLSALLSTEILNLK